MPATSAPAAALGGIVAAGPAGVPAIVGTIVFWLLMCVFIMAAFNILEHLHKPDRTVQKINRGLRDTGILIGSVPGVWVGSHMSVRLPAGTLRTVLGVVLIGAAMGLGAKAGLPISPVVIAAVPIILATIILWDRFRNQVRRIDADTEAKEPGDIRPGRRPPP